MTSRKSPDRMDALVWALTALFEGNNAGLIEYYAMEVEKMNAERAAEMEPCSGLNVINASR